MVSCLLMSFACVKDWARIILDEAHKIKGRTNSTGKSVNALSGSKRWCLTGTPIQNRVAELFGLVRFLRHDPYAYYLCRSKGCNCKRLEWAFGPKSSRCLDCGHSPMQHSSHFNQHILNPITKCGYSGAGAAAMLRLKADILNPLMLRRTKTGAQSQHSRFFCWFGWTLFALLVLRLPCCCTCCLLQAGLLT